MSLHEGGKERSQASTEHLTRRGWAAWIPSAGTSGRLAKWCVPVSKGAHLRACACARGSPFASTSAVVLFVAAGLKACFTKPLTVESTNVPLTLTTFFPLTGTSCCYLAKGNLMCRDVCEQVRGLV